jgi:hypothetical protein
MAMEISCRQGPGYLIVEVSGQWTVDDLDQQDDVIRDEAEKHGLTRLFINARNLSQPDTEMTRFSAGAYVAKFWPQPFRTAVLYKPELITRFGETVAVNRGAALTVFSDRKAALRWLLQGPIQPDADDG